MNRPANVCLLVLAGLVLLSSSAGAATPQQVDDAIKRAKEYLYSKQSNGNWESAPAKVAAGAGGDGERVPLTSSSQYGGLTAIATYALLASGESPQDPRMKAAIDFLKKVKMEGTYAVGIRAQVWLLIPKTDDVKKMIVEDMSYLREAMRKKGENKGFYHYTMYGSSMDHSCSQYGVLGAWACERAGLEVPLAYWRDVEAGWRESQDKSGGWSYTRKTTEARGPSASMTTAGIATLFITQDYLKADAGIKCTGNIRDTGLEKGLEWITKNFNQVESNCYTLYGIERIGVASGYKYFGTINWFEAGATALVRSQRDGSWSSHGPIPGTAFGILFLVRGRAPVVMNKLIYEQPDPQKKETRIEAPWNQRPRDAANVTKWIARQIERDLNFQVVNLKVEVDDLHDSQILYMSGNEPIALLPEEEAKLKLFVEQGGMILGHADCGSEKFATSFIKLGTKLFPTYEFSELPADHPIYTNQQFMRTKWKAKFNVKSLGNGARELMVLIPQADPGKAWQLMDDKGREEFYQFGANLFLYSVDKQNLRNKGETYLVKSDPSIKPDRTIKVARIEYPGNWNPEPGGWRRQASVMNNDNRVKLEAEPVKLGEGKLAGYRIAHITGTTKLSLKPAAIEELRKWIDGGGRLIIDAAGGNLEFAASAEEVLGQIFPAQSAELKQPIAPDHAIFGSGDNRISEFEYRAYARRTLGTVRRPQLRAIMLNGEPRVIFSREDMSVGLVGQPVDGIVGYDPKTSSKIMSNLLQHFATAASAPATAPATKPAVGAVPN